MKHKVVSALLVMVLFFTTVLNAAAGPVAAEPAPTFYTGQPEPMAEAEPEAVPALAGAFLLGVAASFVANAAYDYAKHQNWIWDREQPQILDTRMEAAFDY